MEQLIERINKLSVAAKAGILAGVVLGVTAILVYFSFMPMEEDIDRRSAELRTIESELAAKQSIADNLTEKRREMDELEAKFQAALTELPERKDMEELLAQLNDIGKKAGLEVAKVVPGVEGAENAFISRIPVAMAVTGNYHEIAMFLQEVANLKRIVNVSNIKLSKPDARGDKIVLGSEFLATTFRFSDSAKTAKTAQGK